MEVFTNALEKKESVKQNLEKFSPEFQTDYDQAAAPDILQLDNDELRKNNVA